MAALGLGLGAVRAGYPERPITMIVPFAVPADRRGISARAAADRNGVAPRGQA